MSDKDNSDAGCGCLLILIIAAMLIMYACEDKRVVVHIHEHRDAPPK